MKHQNDYIFVVKDGKVLYSQQEKKRLGDDCSSDHELLIAKFRLKLKKVGKTTRPFRYDLNQIPYDYIVEVTNRFKGLDLIDRVCEDLWMEVHDIVQESVIKTIPKRKKCKKSKIIWGGLTNSWEKKRSERQRRKGKICPFECRFCQYLLKLATFFLYDPKSFYS